MKRIGISILGSTGSIGTQTLSVVREHPARFRVAALTARKNWEELARQAIEFHPDLVVISESEYYLPLCQVLNGTGIEIAAGREGMLRAAALEESEIVVTATVGYSGLIPTIEAIRAGKRIALANKETLVAAGEIVKRELQRSKAEIIPVDSEHSAIFQCLQGEDRDSVSKLILTASGGPFRTTSPRDLSNVTPADALRHPNWDMGAKVTIDSASMMNKGFEMIEAHWLFDISPERIEIAVHPQSIIHSMVEFCDGSIKAQLGAPDMRLPISYALGYPQRLSTKRTPLGIADYANLTFEAPDFTKFPLLTMAFDAIKKGGNIPCALNAANEIGVEAFLKEKIRFTDLARVAEYVMSKIPFHNHIDLDIISQTNEESRLLAADYINRILITHQ